MTYNTNPQIWDSPASRKAYPRLSVSDDGDVITPTSEVVARFLSAGEAKRILRFAGWHFSGPHGWTDSASTLASADMPASPEPDWAVLGPRLAEWLRSASPEQIAKIQTFRSKVQNAGGFANLLIDSLPA